MSSRGRASTTKPHVAFAITALHDVAGGAERVLTDVANGLYRRGYDVSVLTMQEQNGPSFYPLDFGIRRFDGRWRDAPRRSAGTRGRRKAVSLAGSVARRFRFFGALVWPIIYVPRILAFRRLLGTLRPDVAIGFMPSTFPYLTIAARSTSTPVVASVHNVPDRELGGDPRRWDQNPTDIRIRSASLRWADAVTVLLPSFVAELDEDVRASTFVVPNMIDCSDRPCADVRAAASGNTLLAVGRLSPAKDHETLVRAWAALEPTNPDWRVKIIGNGPLHRQLSQLIEELGLERISISDPTPAISQEYAAARLLVMPSVHEGFGLVTAEAMAHGLPVIGFADCEGTNEIVLHGENGLLVDPEDDRTAALASAIQLLVTDEGMRLRFAHQAPATVERFAPEHVLDLWEGMIAEVLDG